MAIQRAAKIALAVGLLIAGIASFKGCQQTARLNRPVASEGIPEGHEYLMRTDTGSDFYTKLKSSNYSVREITAHRIDATRQGLERLELQCGLLRQSTGHWSIGQWLGTHSARQRR